MLGSGHSGLNALTQHMNSQMGRAVDLGDQMFPPPKKDLKTEKQSMMDLIAKANSRPNTDGGSKGSMAAMIAKANQRKSKSSHGAPNEEEKKQRPVPNWKANQIIDYYLKQGGTEIHRSDEEVLYNTKTLDMDYYKAINSKGSYKGFTEMQDAFKILNNGSASEVIQVDQLENVLGQWGERLHRNEMKEFLAVADPRGIGSVRYNDFLQFVTKLRIKPLESNSRLYNNDDDIVGTMKKKRLHHEQVVRSRVEKLNACNCFETRHNLTVFCSYFEYVVAPQVLTELRAKEKERTERHRLLDSRKKWREEEERAQHEKERLEHERIRAADRKKNVRPTDISDHRQFDKPQSHQRRTRRDLEASKNNDAPYSALDAGGDNDKPYSHSSARGSAVKRERGASPSRGQSPNGGNSVLSQLQKAYGSSQEGPTRRKRPGASGSTPRGKGGTPRSREPSPRPGRREPSPRPQGSTPRVNNSREGTPRQRRPSQSPGGSNEKRGGSSGKKRSGSGNMRRSGSSGTLRDAGRRSLQRSGSSQGESQSPQYTGF